MRDVEMHDADLRDQISSLKSIDNIAYSSSKSSSVGSDEQVLARFGKRQQFKVVTSHHVPLR